MPPLHRVALRAATLLMLLATLLWLAGCGGGGDEPCRPDFVGPPAPGTEAWPLCPDDGRGRVSPPDCITHPERCA